MYIPRPSRKKNSPTWPGSSVCDLFLWGFKTWPFQGLEFYDGRSWKLNICAFEFAARALALCVGPLGPRVNSEDCTDCSDEHDWDCSTWSLPASMDEKWTDNSILLPTRFVCRKNLGSRFWIFGQIFPLKLRETFMRQTKRLEKFERLARFELPSWPFKQEPGKAI